MSSEPSPTAKDSTAEELPVGPDEWVDRYGDSLYRFALVRLGNAYEAEDAVQETFLAAIASQEQYSGAGSQRNWLISILRRKVIDAMRLRGRNAGRRKSRRVTTIRLPRFLISRGSGEPARSPSYFPNIACRHRSCGNWCVIA